METPRRFQGCPAQLSLQLQLYRGLWEMGALVHLQGRTASPASEMAFAKDVFSVWVKPSANKSQDFFWSPKLSWCDGNLHHSKMWLRHILKKIPGCREHLQQETLRQSSYIPDPSLGEYSQGEEEVACQPDLVLIQLPVRHQSGFLLLGFTCLRNSCSFLGLSRSYRALIAFVCN